MASSRSAQAFPPIYSFLTAPGRRHGVWYYAHPLPEGRKDHTKTQPLRFEEFALCQAWRTQREENEHAWKVPISELLARNYNLDRKNPRAKEDIQHLPPEQPSLASWRKSSSLPRS
jgi:type I restriction enzyme M protein